MYFKRAVAKMRDENASRPATGKRTLSQLKVMKVHAEYWDSLSSSSRAAFHRQAVAHQAQSAADTLTAMEEVEGALDVEIMRQAASESSESGDHGVRVSATVFPNSCWQNLSEITSGPPTAAMKNKEMRVRAGACPDPVPLDPFQARCSSSLMPRPTSAEVSDSYRMICKLRTQFQSAVFGIPPWHDGGWPSALAVLLRCSFTGCNGLMWVLQAHTLSGANGTRRH